MTSVLRQTSLLLLLWLCRTVPAMSQNRKQPEPSALDDYVRAAKARTSDEPGIAVGSLWNPASPMLNLGGDFRAAHVDDVLTILIVEEAQAVAQGSTSSSRNSGMSLSGSVGAASAGSLSNLAGMGSQWQLNGKGATSRSTQLRTALSARVTDRLPNGELVVFGQKEVTINSERQLVSVRGVIRPADLSPANVVRSDQIAQMELRINGKGIVAESVRRPFILYRLLLGLWPL